MAVTDKSYSWTRDLVEIAHRFDSEHAGPDWLRDLRKAGRQQLVADGLPLMHDEAWTYANVRPLTDKRFRAAKGQASETSGWQPLSALKLRPSTAVTDYPRHAFTALNAAFAGDFFNVTVKAGSSRVIEITHRLQPCHDSGTLYADAVRVDLEPGSQATVVEKWEPSDQLVDSSHDSCTSLHVPSTDLVLAPGATLRYYRLARDDLKAYEFSSIRAAVGADANLDLALVGGGMAIARTEVTVTLLDRGAHANLAGAAILSGPTHGITHTCVQHRAPDCVSDQLFKTVLIDGARSAFQGTIDVDQVAQGTDAFQLSKTLLLHPNSRSDARPQLRIGADQVRCTHGATSGPLAPEQLHYLQGRGLSRRDATSMLVYGFLEEMNRKIKNREANDLLKNKLRHGLDDLTIS